MSAHGPIDNAGTYTRSANVSLTMVTRNKWKQIRKLYNEAERVFRLYCKRLPEDTNGSHAYPHEYNIVSEKETWLSRYLTQTLCREAKKKFSKINSLKASLNAKKESGQPQEQLDRLNDLIQRCQLVLRDPPNFNLKLGGQCVGMGLFPLNKELKHKNWIVIQKVGFEKGSFLCLPFKKTKVFKKWEHKGVLSNFINIIPLRNSFVVKCVFTMEPKQRANAKTVGCDIGMRSVYATSTGLVSRQKDGKDIMTIASKMSKKKLGSAARRKAGMELDNYVNWTVNHMRLRNVSCLKLEKLGHFRSSNRFLRCWKPGAIQKKIKSKCEELGIDVVYVSCAYTSQRCSSCSAICSENRPNNSKVFRCCACNFTMDSDVNAAINIQTHDPNVRAFRPRGLPRNAIWYCTPW